MWGTQGRHGNSLTPLDTHSSQAADRPPSEQKGVVQLHPWAEGEVGPLRTGTLGPAPSEPSAGLPSHSPDTSTAASRPLEADISLMRLTMKRSKQNEQQQNPGPGGVNTLAKVTLQDRFRILKLFNGSSRR